MKRTYETLLKETTRVCRQYYHLNDELCSSKVNTCVSLPNNEDRGENTGEELQGKNMLWLVRLHFINHSKTERQRVKKDQDEDSDGAVLYAEKEKIFPSTENEAAEIVNQFDTNADLIRCFYEKMKKNHLLPSEGAMKQPKHEDAADSQRKRGDQLQKKRKYKEALVAYNKALCRAPRKSAAMAYAYAGRSLVYANTGFYDFALDNAELALDNDCSPEFVSELVERKQKLHALMTGLHFEICGSVEKIELSHPKNQLIPSIVDGLEFANSNVYGRHIVTQRDLKSGDIVALEKPFLTAPYKDHEYTRCFNCLAHNFYYLIPCPISTRVMFCSKACSKVAWERFYRYECPIIDGIFDWVDSLFAVRATFKALTAFEDQAEMMKLINPDSVNPFECDFRNIDERTKIRLFNSMSTNQERRAKLDILRIVYICATVFHMVKEYTEFSLLLEDKNFETLFLELLMRFQQIEEINNFSIIELKKGEDFKETFSASVIGQGNYFVSYLFAHSCAPNIGMFQADYCGKLGFIVLRPIKAGETLFITYGPNFIKKDKASRQEMLKNAYQFDCNCEACANDTKFTPKPASKLHIPRNLVKLTAKISPKVCNFDDKAKQIAVEVIEKISEFMSKKADKHYPCPHLFALEVILQDAICIFVLKKPMDLYLEDNVLGAKNFFVEGLAQYSNEEKVSWKTNVIRRIVKAFQSLTPPSKKYNLRSNEKFKMCNPQWDL